MPAQVDQVLLQRQLFRGPPPRLAKHRPQMLATAHHRIVIFDHVVDRQHAQSETLGFKEGGDDEIFG